MKLGSLLSNLLFEAGLVEIDQVAEDCVQLNLENYWDQRFRGEALEQATHGGGVTVSGGVQEM